MEAVRGVVVSGRRRGPVGRKVEGCEGFEFEIFGGVGAEEVGVAFAFDAGAFAGAEVAGFDALVATGEDLLAAVVAVDEVVREAG